jgi:G3E family GTPase
MVNLDIVTGFLGAGKTTLINRMLAEAYTGEKPVLIENEFGEVGIDDSLIEDPQVQVRLLSSGCICCSLKGDFVEGISQVVEQLAPSRIIIEPTGLADPSDVLSACAEAGKAVQVRVNAFITIVNAKNFLPLLSAGGEIYKKQISMASMLVLNRTKQLRPDKFAESMDELRRINPNGLILDEDSMHPDALTILTLAEGTTAPCADCGSHGCQHDHAHEIKSLENISSLSFFPKKLFSKDELTGLFEVFAKGSGEQILRAKGFLKKAEGGYAHLEYVYGQGELFDSAYSGPPKFVVIGYKLNKTALTRVLGEE